MKIKIKLTIEQYKYLIYFVERNFLNLCTELSALNSRLFIATGYKKLIDLQSELRFTPNKIKTFNIEVNQYYAILDMLTVKRFDLDSYTLPIFEDFKSQNKAILGYK